MYSTAIIHSTTVKLESMPVFIEIATTETLTTLPNQDDAYWHTVCFNCAEKTHDKNGNAGFEIFEFHMSRNEFKKFVKTLEEVLEAMPSEDDEV